MARKGGLATAMTPFNWEGERAILSSVLSGERSECEGGPHGTFRRSGKTHSGRRASDSAHHSRSGNTD